MTHKSEAEGSGIGSSAFPVHSTALPTMPCMSDPSSASSLGAEKDFYVSPVDEDRIYFVIGFGSHENEDILISSTRRNLTTQVSPWEYSDAIIPLRQWFKAYFDAKAQASSMIEFMISEFVLSGGSYGKMFFRASASPVQRLFELRAEQSMRQLDSDVKPPSPEAFDDAFEFMSHLDLNTHSIMPSIDVADDGEINFFWKSEGLHIDLGFYGTGTYSYFARRSNGESFKGDDIPASHGLTEELDKWLRD